MTTLDAIRLADIRQRELADCLAASERARSNLEELMRMHRDAERELQLRIALLEAENAHLREQVALFMGMA